MPVAEAAFIAKINGQVGFLKDREYNYDLLRVYVSGIARPWSFGREDEFEFDGDELLVVRVGPSKEIENEGVPEYVFPIRQIVATELTQGEGL
jgi:hypothetical protein